MQAFIEKTTTWWALLGGLILLSIVLVTVANAGAFTLDKIARLYGTNVSGLPGYEDFVRLAISSAALMLFPYCQLRRGHIAVDLFAKMMPLRLRRALDILSLGAMATLAVALAWWMWRGMGETQADGALSRVLGWPEWPFYLPGIVSLLLMAVVAAFQAVDGEHRG